MVCKKYLSGSEKQKKKFKQVRGSCIKLVLQIKIYDTTFTTGPLVSSYATGSGLSVGHCRVPKVARTHHGTLHSAQCGKCYIFQP
jgi:hypothetical protein